MEGGGDPHLEAEGDLSLLLDEDRLKDEDHLPHSEDQEDLDLELEMDLALVVLSLTSQTR